MNIYVSNLPGTATSTDLRDLFATFGEVISAKIVTDRGTGQSRGFGFVEMTDTTESKNAVAALHDSQFQGNALSVSEARPKPGMPVSSLN
jgi:RNA recognition motif-containing protein